MAQKKIKLESISEKNKKKKDFLIIYSIIFIVGFLLFAVGHTFLSVSKEKAFKKREEAKIKDDVSLLPSKDFKENWAISIENSIAAQNKVLERFMEKTSSDLNKTQHALKNMVVDSIAREKENIEQLAKKQEERLKKLEEGLTQKLEEQNKRIREIELEKNLGGGASGSKPENDLGLDDLTPNIGENLSVEDIVNHQVKKVGKTEGGKGKPESSPPSFVKEFVKGGSTVNVSGKDAKEVAVSERNPVKPVEKRKKISFLDIDTEAAKSEIIAKNKKIREMKNKKAVNGTYHVMIGLSKAFMITGAYAPAFSAGEEDPLPVLLQADGDVLIANNDYESVDKCLLIGTAKGNMNSKTADIRLVKISCSLNEGEKMIEGSINGWVIGENGIPGVPGELLHKNGAWLAQTFVAGFMQTFSQAFQASNATPINFGDSGNGDDTVSASRAIGQNAYSAAAGGMSTVFGKLGDYYLKMASQIFPVIEVKGGRTVNILLKGGENLSVQDFNKIDVPTIDNTLSENEEKKQETFENPEVLGYTVKSKEKKEAGVPLPDLSLKLGE